MSTSIAMIEREVREFLQQNSPAEAEQIAAMADDAPIWGLVDSLLLLDLIEYLEIRFEFTVSPADFIPDNFMTVAMVARYVARHEMRAGDPT